MSHFTIGIPQCVVLHTIPARAAVMTEMAWSLQRLQTSKTRPAEPGGQQKAKVRKTQMVEQITASGTGQSRALDERRRAYSDMPVGPQRGLDTGARGWRYAVAVPAGRHVNTSAAGR
ncbi:MAG: hypothetical protein ACPHUF_03225 [Gammaproteobacteria bacterium]